MMCGAVEDYWTLSTFPSHTHIVTYIRVSSLPCLSQREIVKKKKVKLTTGVEGDQKVPFSIATTPRCKGALPLSLDRSTLPLIRTLYC